MLRGPRHGRRLAGVRIEMGNREQEGEEQGLEARQRIANPARFARTSSSMIGVLSIS